MRAFACALAVSFAAVSAFAADTPRPTADVRQACKADVETHCKGVQPGGGRIAACLREKKDQVSESCKTAIAAMMKERQASGAGSSSGGTTQTTPAN